MLHVARLLPVSAAIGAGSTTVSPLTAPYPRPVGQGYALCATRSYGHALVQVDSLRRVLVCAFVTMAHGGPYKMTPQLLRLGDTLFVSAVTELPKSENVFFTEVTDVPYQVLYGPLPRRSRLRITDRKPGGWPKARAALDTTIRIP